MIDFKLIDNSITFFEEKGYSRIEVPWLVTQYASEITAPKDHLPYYIPNKNKSFVASAEQSFLYLYLKEQLPKGRFQAVTPCLRNDSFDFTHTKYFIKNELIDTENTSYQSLLNTVQNAEDFFNSLFPEKVELVDTEEGFDIEYKGFELGSYGVRECDFLKWVYGTACAEPRTSKLINKYVVPR